MRLFENRDCMKGMKEYPDKYFDLAIVDPPYGIGKNWLKDTASKFYSHKSTYNNRPVDKEYFDQLFRVSKDQIIWGANYYWNYLEPTSNIIGWDKVRDANIHKRSAFELAWTSITKLPAHIFRFSWNGCATSEPRYGFHPHEKPINLYRWLLKHYATAGDLILDTHVGSASSLIACIELGFDYVGYELDSDYFKSATERIKRFESQLNLFKPARTQAPKHEQTNLLADEPKFLAQIIT